MPTRFSRSILISGIFVIIGTNLYTPGAGFTFQNIVGAATILFFGCLALIAAYACIRQFMKPNKVV